MDNAKVHTAKVVSSVLPDLRLKRTPQPSCSPDICLSDFFFFGWLKGKLQQQQYKDPGQLFQAVDEIFNSLSVGMIEDVFETGFINWASYCIRWCLRSAKVH
jgi:hypothetical protein